MPLCDVIPGVPVVNPLWNRNTANTVPYWNPAAFSRPVYAKLGNASRTLDYARDRAAFGDCAILPTPVFFYGMDPGEEVSVDIERGKTLIVRFVAVSEVRDDGTGMTLSDALELIPGVEEFDLEARGARLVEDVPVKT